MSRKKSVVFRYYANVCQQQNSLKKIKFYERKFCKKVFALHATRMANHVVIECKKCPEVVKNAVKVNTKLKLEKPKPQLKALNATLRSQDGDQATTVHETGETDEVSDVQQSRYFLNFFCP